MESLSKLIDSSSELISISYYYYLISFEFAALIACSLVRFLDITLLVLILWKEPESPPGVS